MTQTATIGIKQLSPNHLHTSDLNNINKKTESSNQEIEEFRKILLAKNFFTKTEEIPASNPCLDKILKEVPELEHAFKQTSNYPENLLDNFLANFKKENGLFANKLLNFIDKIAKREEKKIMPIINSLFLVNYVVNPFLSKIPKLEKLNVPKNLLNLSSRGDLTSKAIEKLIKATKRNDLFRIVPALFDITTAIFTPLKDLYLVKAVIVAITNLAEKLEAKLNFKHGAYQNLWQGPQEAWKILKTGISDLKHQPAKIASFKWLNDNCFITFINLVFGTCVIYWLNDS